MMAGFPNLSQENFPLKVAYVKVHALEMARLKTEEEIWEGNSKITFLYSCIQ